VVLAGETRDQRLIISPFPRPGQYTTWEQTYYFDDAGLLRRLDYSVDILGGGPAVHYPSDYREFDGIMVPHPFATSGGTVPGKLT
jgi:hypothetical protein